MDAVDTRKFSIQISDKRIPCYLKAVPFALIEIDQIQSLEDRFQTKAEMAMLESGVD
jgi:hypothetical protein